MTKHSKVLYLFTVLTVSLIAPTLVAQQSDQEEMFHLTNQIRKKIISLNNYGVFDWITFSLTGSETGYTVTLHGYASRPTLQQSAERVVQRLPLVESVTNQIEVLPTSRNDDNIRAAAYARIYGHSVLRRYNPNRGTPFYGVERRVAFGISNDPPLGRHAIQIIVNNGNITLEGVVDTDVDKAVAEAQANSVSGVFSVTNNLQVLRPKKNG
jgi:hypothetical protein